MDLSQFLDVTCDEGDTPLDNLTEDDIVLIDDEEPVTRAVVSNGKRTLPNQQRGPPFKKVRRATNGGTPVRRIAGGAARLNNQHQDFARSLGIKDLSVQAAEILKTQNITLKKVTESPPARARAQGTPNRPTGSITWKYRQLPENQYTADIRKQDLLKDYESERCMCKEPPPGQLACGEGCINRSTFTECDPELCEYKERCGNQRIQRRQYAPGLERFMTQKKGWGVRARQSIARGAFILEYTGEICTSAEFEKRMLSRYIGDSHHYCLGLDSKTMIDAHRAGSECRFVNHSCDPNCEMEKWTVGGLYRMALFATKDILPGEEICYDYNFSLFNTDQGQECKCGARSCRGVIGGKRRDFLITLNGDDAAQAAQTPQKVAVATDPSGQVLADEKWFKSHLSEEELAWLEKHAPKFQQLEAKTIKCTVCNECLNFKLLGQVQRHPELGVIMCNKCRKGYGKGGWDRDKEGNDEFCRWCSQGGQIYLCDFCPKAFCNQCLKWNLGRKYIKKIEDEDKWKCLSCDPAEIRPARADYYAIHKYHKERAAKGGGKGTSSKVNGRLQPMRPGASPGRAKAVIHAVHPVRAAGGVVRGGKAPRGAAVVRSGTQLLPMIHNGRSSGATGSPGQIKKHFVDSMLLEADRAANRFRSMVHEIRRSWCAADRDDKTVMLATRKIREALTAARTHLEAADAKVIDIYRTNVEDADVRDIEPGSGGEEQRLIREEEIFAKSELVDTNGIETLETTPDLPFSLEEEDDDDENDQSEKGDYEKGKRDSKPNGEEEKEGGIHDTSVDGLREEHTVEKDVVDDSEASVTEAHDADADPERDAEQVLLQEPESEADGVPVEAADEVANEQSTPQQETSDGPVGQLEDVDTVDDREAAVPEPEVIMPESATAADDVVSVSAVATYAKGNGAGRVVGNESMPAEDLMSAGHASLEMTNITAAEPLDPVEVLFPNDAESVTPAAEIETQGAAPSAPLAADARLSSNDLDSSSVSKAKEECGIASEVDSSEGLVLTEGILRDEQRVENVQSDNDPNRLSEPKTDMLV